MRADALDLLSQVQPARVAAYDLSAQARELLNLAGAQASGDRRASHNDMWLYVSKNHSRFTMKNIYLINFP